MNLVIIDQVPVATRRRNAFTSAGVPNLREAIDGRITALRPLQVDDYGIILVDQGVMIGRGTSTVYH